MENERSSKVSTNDIGELIGQIVDVFEVFLESKGINIPNKEKGDSDNPAIIYGTDYGQIQSELEDLFYHWGIFEGWGFEER